MVSGHIPNSTGGAALSPVSQERGGRLFLLGLFLVCVLIPVHFDVAGLVLSPIRILLLIAFVPLAAMLLAGRYGPVTWIDGLMLFHGLWMLVALTAVHGTARIAFAGISMVEILGGYLYARAVIRNAEDYRWLIGFVFWAAMFVLPFAVIENIDGRQFLLDALSKFGEAPAREGSADVGRWGMNRAYGLFEHPILWGMFCSLLFANILAMLQSTTAKLIVSVLVFYATMTALSSAPMLSCAMQIFLLLWGRITGGRWRLLIILTVVFYVVIDALSNRTPVTILIETLTFNVGSSWTRIFIFEYGWAAVQRSPLFGIGFNDWPRPPWLTKSVDNFWLVTAMRYGIVGVGALLAAFVLQLWRAARADIGDPQTARIRKGYCIVLTGLMFTLITVHVWGSMACYVAFFLGAGTFFHNSGLRGSADTSDLPIEAADPRVLRYTRFGPEVRPDHARDIPNDTAVRRAPAASHSRPPGHRDHPVYRRSEDPSA